MENFIIEYEKLAIENIATEKLLKELYRLDRDKRCDGEYVKDSTLLQIEKIEQILATKERKEECQSIGIRAQEQILMGMKFRCELLKEKKGNKLTGYSLIGNTMFCSDTLDEFKKCATGGEHYSNPLIPNQFTTESHNFATAEEFQEFLENEIHILKNIQRPDCLTIRNYYSNFGHRMASKFKVGNW